MGRRKCAHREKPNRLADVDLDSEEIYPKCERDLGAEVAQLLF